ncbi:MAG: hypothetical protein GX641_02585, partial [Mollicutes bacterium]|nr:hypothetical protein [Mollicutes bacterium]
MAFLEDLLRTITFFIDKLIYSFIPTVYNFIYELADRVIFSQAELETIARNIYAIIGIFMLFRLSFVLLISIVNPDNLTDKEKGFTKMISKIVIAIVMITAIPIGFDLAYQLQGAILKNAIVEKVILGNEISTSELTPEISCKYDISNSGTFQDYYIGEDINFIVLFFSEGSDKTIRPTIKYLNNTNTEINPDNYIYSSKELVKSKFLDLTGNVSCLTNIRLALNTDDIEPYVEIRMFNGSGDHENMFLISEPAKKNNEKGGVLLARKAFEAFMNCNPNTDSCSNDEEGTVPASGLNINQAISQGIPLKGESDFSLISNALNKKQGEEYILNYTPLLSTITGGAILALLLVLCFDVATRVVKLAFFQIITPVA